MKEHILIYCCLCPSKWKSVGARSRKFRSVYRFRNHKAVPVQAQISHRGLQEIEEDFQIIGT